MAEVIRLSRSVVGEREKAALSRVIDNGYLGTGRETQAFEEELGEFIGGGRSVTCVASGTAALQLSLEACGIGPGDEVLLPSLTFVSAFQAVAATGARPVACEALLATANLDVADAARRVTVRTRAIMPVYYASETPDLEGIYGLAGEHGLRVIEDAAHAFGCRRGEGRVGCEGDILCFSFDGIKNITSGEGGAVVTADPDTVRAVQDARLLGVKHDSERRYRGERSWEFDVTEQGWRYHMSDLMAAIGRTQLTRFDAEFAPRRIDLARRYRVRLRGHEGVQFLDADLGNVIPHIQPIRITGGRRDAVRAYLVERGCQVGIHYKPNHLLSRFRQAAELPVTECLGDQLMSIPLHPLLTDEAQDRVIELLMAALEETAKGAEA